MNSAVSPWADERNTDIVVASIILLSIASGILFESLFFLALPVLFFVLFIVFTDPYKVYLGFFILLPFSLEVSLPGGVGTDLPAEPIMLGLTVIAILFFIKNFKLIPASYLLHPISLLLIVHILWIGLASLYSQQIVVSVKFLLAKIWYVIPFFGLTLFWIKDIVRLKQIIVGLCVSCFIAAAAVLIRHSATGFSFSTINDAVYIFFRNHVSYACILTLVVPMLFYLCKWNWHKKFLRIILLSLLVFFIVAIYLSYTRAALGALGIAVVAAYIIRWRLVPIAISSALLMVLLGTAFLIHENKYLDFAPNYEKTISHYEFDNLLEATVKMEDISTMERVYRWVAGIHMIPEHPWVGFGPGNFYFFYHKHTVTSFKTYVSNNPEKSGVHNYYLMTFIEQGLIGFLLFISLCIVALLKGQQLYHQLQTTIAKDVCMLAMLLLIIILAIILINDMLEAAKVGPFFFLALALLVQLGIRKDHFVTDTRGYPPNPQE